jgi:hypothetical protein
MTPRDIARQAVIMGAIASRAAKVKNACRTELADGMINGDKLVAVDPDHSELVLGEVLRTKPSGTAQIVDRAAFTKWMATVYPEQTTTVPELPERQRDRDRAFRVIREHAPELVIDVTTVVPGAESHVLRATVEAREACGPGGELGIPGVVYVPPGDGEIRVSPSPDALAAIERLWREGQIDLNTGELLEIESGESNG